MWSQDDQIFMLTENKIAFANLEWRIATEANNIYQKMSRDILLCSYWSLRIKFAHTHVSVKIIQHLDCSGILEMSSNSNAHLWK